MMGSIEQRMLIAFQCYDENDDQVISQEETVIVLKNVPMTYKPRIKDLEFMKPERQ
jgi:Ca2+-binding EF-hand superfamily protein